MRLKHGPHHTWFITVLFKDMTGKTAFLRSCGQLGLQGAKIEADLICFECKDKYNEIHLPQRCPLKNRSNSFVSSHFKKDNYLIKTEYEEKKIKPSLKLSWKERLSKKNSSNFPILHQITHQMKRLGRILENNNLQEHQFKKWSRKLKRLCLQREGSQWSKGKHRSSFPKNNWGWVSMELPLS